MVCVGTSPRRLVGGASAEVWPRWCTLQGQVNPLIRSVAEPGEEGRLTGLGSAAWALGSLCGGQLHGWGVEGRLRLLYAALGLVLVAAERAAAAVTPAAKEHTDGE